MAERRFGTPAPETDTTLAGLDWDGLDISAERHARVLFTDLDTTDAEGTGPVFEECTFRRGRFGSMVLTNAAFTNCTFIDCSFLDAKFNDCKLVGTMFDRCRFDNMRVTGGNWSFVGMPGADLRLAGFSGVRMREADLTFAKLEGASMRDVDLVGASLHHADLSKCDLRGSDLSTVDPTTVRMHGAIITIDQTIIVAEALGLDVRME
jgi:uncharacterized protein YjbI with pentapeptide repeats